MCYLRLAILFLLLSFMLFCPVTQHNAIADRADARQPYQSEEAPPPLPGGCGDFGTPVSYENPVCCVSGYVYADGAPVAGATITVSSNEKTRTAVTSQQDDVANPHYRIQLDNAPLLVRPGSIVTVTATYGELSTTKTFTAASGGQQVDLVLPVLAPDSSWQPIIADPTTPAPPFLQRAGYAIAPEGGEQYLIFGGSLNGTGLGAPVADTYRWRRDGWVKLTPNPAPPARTGHRLAPRRTDNTLLLFGGLGKGETFLADTWLWHADQWRQVVSEPVSLGLTTAITPTAPAPRAWYALTYDETRQHWLLFGGGTTTETFGDTWLFKEGQWLEQHPATAPPPRKMATLTYNEETGLLYLFGGHAEGQILDDFWQWDGERWQEIASAVRPLGRYGHAAAYHSPTRSLLIVGGAAAGVLRDTWAWDGVRWRPRVAVPPLMPYQRATMYAEGTTETMILFGELAGGNDAGDGIAHYIVQQAPSDAMPIATIRYADHLDLRQGRDHATLLGDGSDGDATDVIVGYRWTHGDVLLSNQRQLTIAAEQLPLGLQTLSFTVQDDEGNWSLAVKRKLWVRSAQTGALDLFQPKWTLLLYLSADNAWGLTGAGASTIAALIQQLQAAGPQAGVEIALLVDGPQPGDSRIYHLSAQGEWRTLPLTAIQVNSAEVNMGHAETLGQFIRWGQRALPNDYLALFLIGPANALVGFGADVDPATQRTPMHTDGSVLTPAALRTALEIGAGGGTRQIDLLYLDGSSFGLLENAASVYGLAHYVIASPGTRAGGYSYPTYRQLAGAAQSPRTYATAVAQAYTAQGQAARLPTTVAVWDMAYFAPVAAAVDQLGAALTAYAGQSADNQAQVAQIRRQLQLYDSGGQSTYQLDAEDAYVDLLHLAATSIATRTNGAILDAALQVREKAQNFVVWAEATNGDLRLNGNTVRLDYPNHHGLGIFYPPTGYALAGSANLAYSTHQLFPLTVQWGWTHFILPDELPPLPPGYQPPQTDSKLLLAPLDSGATSSSLYLPFIVR